MGCARCHDHKFEPISQKEFYRFYAFFNSVNEKGVYTEQRGNVPPLLALQTPKDQAAMTRLAGQIGLELFRKWFGNRSDAGDKRLARLEKEANDYAKRIPSVMIMAELPRPRDTYLLKRGAMTCLIQPSGCRRPCRRVCRLCPAASGDPTRPGVLARGFL